MGVMRKGWVKAQRQPEEPRSGTSEGCQGLRSVISLCSLLEAHLQVQGRWRWRPAADSIASWCLSSLQIVHRTH